MTKKRLDELLTKFQFRAGVELDPVAVSTATEWIEILALARRGLEAEEIAAKRMEQALLAKPQMDVSTGLAHALDYFALRRVAELAREHRVAELELAKNGLRRAEYEYMERLRDTLDAALAAVGLPVDE